MRTFPQIAEEPEEENYEMAQVSSSKQESEVAGSYRSRRNVNGLSLDLRKCRKKKDLPFVKPAVVITKSIDESNSESDEETMKKSPSPSNSKPRCKSPSLSLDYAQGQSRKSVTTRTDSLPTEKLSPHSHFWEHGARMRRKSGDDVLSACSSSHKNAIFDAFRPRSKSDSKSKKPNIVSVLKNSLSSGSPMSPRKHFYRKTPPPSPLTQPSPVQGEMPSCDGDAPKDSDVCSKRSKDSDSYKFSKTGAILKNVEKDAENYTTHRGSPVSKVMDMFRARSSSVSGDSSSRRKLYGEKSSSNSSIQVPASLLRRHSVDPEKKKVVPSYQRASVDGTPDHSSVFLFRSPDGTVCTDPFYDKAKAQLNSEEEDLVFVRFFQHHSCYDCIPTSAKLLVFDSQLIVKHAFHALVQNSVRAAPLWSSKDQAVTGMITVTDFIHMLQKYYKSPLVQMDELEEHKLELWNSASNPKSGLISISPYASLFEAIRMLIKHRVHRLPVIDPATGNVLYILTHKRILKFMFVYMNDIPQPSFLKKSIRELNIGTYDNIATAKPDTPLITALNMFIEKKVSALPVVDDDGKVVDIYAKFDVINLAAERTYNNLDMTIRKALKHRNEWFEGVHNCKINESLASVMERICKAEVHRLVVVDDDGRVKGVISLSDILKSLVDKHQTIKKLGERGEANQSGSLDRSNTCSNGAGSNDQSKVDSEANVPSNCVNSQDDSQVGDSKSHTCSGATQKGHACPVDSCKASGAKNDDCNDNS